MTENAGNPSFSILLVDDEAKNIQLLANILSKSHYDIEFATNGEEALNWVNSKNFDLILLDIMMPGLDGYQVCKKIKADSSKSHIPIIFLTAKTSPEDVNKGFESGGADYITKPFNTLELLARVKIQLEMKILRGVLPICASCKDIRNDDGVWEKLESYLQEHSLALFSHGMCITCAEKLYGNEEWYIGLKEKNDLNII